MQDAIQSKSLWVHLVNDKFVKRFYALQVLGHTCKNGHLTLIYAYFVSHIFGQLVFVEQEKPCEMKSLVSCSSTICLKTQNFI